MKQVQQTDKPARANGPRRILPVLGFALCIAVGWLGMMVDVWWWGAVGLAVGLAVGDLLEWLVRDRTPYG